MLSNMAPCRMTGRVPPPLPGIYLTSVFKKKRESQSKLPRLQRSKKELILGVFIFMLGSAFATDPFSGTSSRFNMPGSFSTFLAIQLSLMRLSHPLTPPFLKLNKEPPD